MIAWAYTRKSSDEGEKDPDAKSVERQAKRAREYAATKGWLFDDRHVYTDDAVSGAEFEKRRGLMRLLRDLEATPRPKVDVLIVSEDSRLGRFKDSRQLGALTLRINQAGVKIYGYLDDKEIGEGIEGMFKGYAASEERRRASQRTKDGMMLVHELGKHAGGSLYGYRHVKTGKVIPTRNGSREETKRVINPQEAKVVLMVFDLRAKGKGRTTIKNVLNEKKIPAPRAGHPTHKQGTAVGERVKVNAEGLWSAAQVGYMLRNQHYVGIVTRNGRTRTDEALRIVPEKLWRDVQRVNKLAANENLRRPGGQIISKPSGKHWITRFVRCGVCDSPMHVRWETGRDSEKGYLFCSRRHGHGKKGCPNGHRLSVVRAEEQIAAKFQSVLTAAAVLDKVEAWTRLRREAKLEMSVDRKALNDEQARLKGEIGKLVDALASVGATDEIKRAIEDRKGRLEHVDGQLRSAEVLHEFDVRTIRDAVDGVLKEWRQQLDLNPDVIGQVLGKLVTVRMRLTPQPPDGKEWLLDSEVDYSGVLREADPDLVGAMETLLRELEIRSAGAGRASLPIPFAGDGLPPDGPRPRPRPRASISAKAPWRTCWRRSESPR
jgi:DNA invertase Pin-like site-specific DNA recombinase